jgi:hypothetical protein
VYCGEACRAAALSYFYWPVAAPAKDLRLGLSKTCLQLPSDSHTVSQSTPWGDTIPRFSEVADKLTGMKITDSSARVIGSPVSRLGVKNIYWPSSPARSSLHNQRVTGSASTQHGFFLRPAHCLRGCPRRVLVRGRLRFVWPALTSRA